MARKRIKTFFGAAHFEVININKSVECRQCDSEVNISLRGGKWISSLPVVAPVSLLSLYVNWFLNYFVVYILFI